MNIYLDSLFRFEHGHLLLRSDAVQHPVEPSEDHLDIWRQRPRLPDSDSVDGYLYNPLPAHHQALLSPSVARE